MITLTILTLENDPLVNGRLRLTIDGVPSGTLTLAVSRTPDGVSEVIILPTVASGGYYYATPPPAPMYYVWLQDGGVRGADHAAVWLYNASVTAGIGKKLRDVLIANKKGVEALMQVAQPGVTVKQIVYGHQTDVTEFPAILITNGRVRPSYFGIGFLSQYEHFFEIECIVVSEGERSLTEMTSRMGEATWRILRSPFYDSFIVDTIEVNLGAVGDVSYTESRTEGGRLTSYAMLSWSGNTAGVDAGEF